MKIKVLEFQKEYPSINLDLQKQSEEMYDLAIVWVYMSELGNGYMVSRRRKTYKKGTKFNFKPIESEEELQSYFKTIMDFINALNNKHGTDYRLKEILEKFIIKEEKNYGEEEV